MSDSPARRGSGGVRHAYETIKAVYISFLFGALPLIYHHHYLDILDVKAAFYFVLTFIVFLCALVCKAVDARMSTRVREGAFMDGLTHSAERISIGVFLVVNTVSCLLSANPIRSFIGEPGRLTGLGFLLLLGISHLITSNARHAVKWGFIALGVSGFLVSALGTVNFLGFDPLGMYQDLLASQRGTFISTIGNRNFYGAFLCLFIPVCMAAFVLCRRRLHLAASGVLCVVGFMAALAGRSDSTFVGLLAATVVLCIASLREKGRFLRFLIIILFMSVASVTCGALKAMRLHQPSQAAVSISSALMLGGAKYVLWGTGAAALFALLFLRHEVSDRRMGCIQRAVTALVAMALILLAVLFIYFNAINRTIPLDGGWKYLRITDEWGTYRGLIWDRSVKLFSSFPLWRMLIGCGPDMFGSEMALEYGEELIKATGWSIDNAHNEYLQILITSGFLGLAAYMTLIIIRLKKLLSSLASGESAALMLILPIVAYAAQATFNLWQPITTPIFFVFLALPTLQNVNQRMSLSV